VKAKRLGDFKGLFDQIAKTLQEMEKAPGGSGTPTANPQH
jgi:hypothetical protein